MGTALNDHPLSRTVRLDDLAKELTRPLRGGLPLSDRTAGITLPNLRNVIARSIHPDDPISRVDSLNTILTRLVTELEHDRFGQPARILYGLAPGMAGTNLTARRLHAARHLACDPDHFRKRLEPEVVRTVAEALYRDMLRYKKRITRSDDTASYNVWAITEDDITAEEELASVIWRFVYAIRCEIIGARRQEKEPGFETRVAEHYDRAKVLAVGLQRGIDNYRHLFGPIIRQCGVEYRVEALLSLVTGHRSNGRVDA